MKIEIKIDGMSCAHCILAIEKNLVKLDLKKIKVDIGSAEIDFDETKIKKEDIAEAIAEAGYRVLSLNKY